MNNSTAFKLAHKMTKQVIQTGDNYQATFGQCLKVVKAQKVAAIQATTNYFEKNDDNILTVYFLFLVAIALVIIKVDTITNAIYTILKVAFLVLSVPISVAAAFVIDYNISF